MTVNPDTEVVATTFSGGMCGYTIERAGHRWTVQIPIHELNQFGRNKQRRREYLAQRLTNAIANKEPDQPPVGQQLKAMNLQRFADFGRAPTPDDPLPLKKTEVGGDV